MNIYFLNMQKFISRNTCLTYEADFQCDDCCYLNAGYIDFELCDMFCVKLTKNSNGDCIRCCECFAAEIKENKLNEIYEG